MKHVLHKGPADADIIDAAVLPEAGVFNGYNGILEIVRYVIERHKDALLELDLSYQRIVVSINLRPGGRILLFKFLDRGDSHGNGEVGTDQRAQQKDRCDDDDFGTH